MRSIIYPMSSLILGISLVVAALIVKDTFKQPVTKSKTTVQKPTPLSIPNPNLMTKEQLSVYLQISEKTIDKIISDDAAKKAELADESYDTYEFLPYLKIDGQERFLKSEVDLWLQYQNDHHDEDQETQ
ncbi:Clp protease ClpB [Pullulanibacillus sp. KACC 23026]|uniref:Clp protease ClpB n=1 Tax=Pullulanibacillus sp. KACC 23026 TaxID=3028315 RepID=UPI0023B07D66|nr:Clp protease ClpB [Pullulanibacillus sp. KACC 23026]WEG14415.1 Clp protease ClpB [Pullulanibacillus sp. KACC 23026]